VAARRTRRSSEEVRSLLLSAARDLFAEHGYAGTTTRAIARRAGVSENLLYSNFGSKERLFDTAVAEPIDDFLREYTERWLQMPLGDGDPDEEIRSFVVGMYTLAREHRKLLRAATPDHLSNGAQNAVARLEHMASEVAKLHGYVYNPAIAVRAAVAMVITMAVYDEPLFGRGGPPATDEVIDELAGLLTNGLKRTA
jgi:AcrR family transcriptional regulator